MSNVLIVSSDQHLLGELSEYCRGSDFTPHGITDGSYVLPWLGERGVSVIIVDTQAQGVDGLSLCQQITQVSNAPLFVLTQSAAESDLLQSKDLAVKAFFARPLRSAEVFSEIKAHIS